MTPPLNHETEQPSPNATVKAALPNSRYRVVMEDGTEILARVSGTMRIRFIRILSGDRVTVEISPYDRTLGRIIYHQQAP